MEKPTNPILYRSGNNKVEQMPYFLYEVSTYKIIGNMAFLINSKYYKSDKAITSRSITKKYPGYTIVYYIEVIGVTENYIKENHLKQYKKK